MTTLVHHLIMHRPPTIANANGVYLVWLDTSVIGIALILLVVAALVALSGGATPFIYTLF